MHGRYVCNAAIFCLQRNKYLYIIRRKEINVFLSIFDYLNAWVDTFDEAKMAYRTYSELSSLSDKDLSNLGLTRADIPRVSFRLDQRV